ncbi:rhodanese-like domain-containing protein [Desertibaculum subflavum]|uniref:rhodanese-like domain-containing protein n=1 Tax=Desertibaculum subflavum TaxID=2268458 RepID=UPI000E668D28
MPATPLQVDAAELAELLRAADPPFLLDVREPWEVEICALPGAVNLPMGQIQQRLGELPPNRPIVVICHHGMRSLQVTHFLRSRGFEAAQNLAGGVDSWAQAVDFTMPRY